MTKINISLFETVSQVKTVAFLWYHVKLSQSSVKTETSQPYPAEVFIPFTCAARAPIKSPQQAWHSTKTSLSYLKERGIEQEPHPVQLTARPQGRSEAESPVGLGPAAAPEGRWAEAAHPHPHSWGQGARLLLLGPAGNPASNQRAELTARLVVNTTFPMWECLHCTSGVPSFRFAFST